MNLWKIVDCWGRETYHEESRRLKGRMKMKIKEQHEMEEVYSHHHNLRTPKCYQVQNDQWVEVEVVSPHELEEYLMKKEEQQRKRQQQAQEMRAEWIAKNSRKETA